MLGVARNFDSKYSFWLYDLIEEYSYSEQSDDFVIIIEDEKLRNALKIPFKMKGNKKIFSYDRPAALARRAIDPVVADLVKSNMRLEIKRYDVQKQDGIYYWRFEIQSKKSKIIDEFSKQHSLELAEIKSDLLGFKVSLAAINNIINLIGSERDLDFVNLQYQNR